MSCTQVLLCIIFPPLAVVDRGCGSVLIVTLLTICGWIPGVVAALIIVNSSSQNITIIQEANKVAGSIDKDKKMETTLSKLNDKQKLTIVGVLIGTLLLCCFCCFATGLMGSILPKNGSTSIVSTSSSISTTK